MIISDSHRLAFVHIPKCAGTTIRASLRSIDSLGKSFDDYFEYPEGGRALLHHLPLAHLRQYFPACYDKVEAYDSYAILRDPRTRFASALFQHLRSFQGLDPSSASSSLFREKAREVCLRLDQPAERRSLDLIFFLPQSAFVALDGRQVVRHLYRIENLRRFAEDFRMRHDIVVDVDVRHNEAGLPPGPGLATLQKAAGAVLRRLTGAGGLARLRSRLRRASGLAPDALYRQVFEDESIARFVDAYYAEDQERYAALLAGRTASPLDGPQGVGAASTGRPAQRSGRRSGSQTAAAPSRRGT